jgi:hypothetical protein
MITLRTNEAFIYFVCSLILGASLGIVYDILRAFRQTFKIKILTLIFDVFFFIVCAVSLYLYSIGTTYGEVRLFVVVGVVSSLILEQLTLSRFITLVFSVLLGFVKTLFFFMLIPIKRPFVSLFKCVKEKVFSNFHKKLLKKRSRILYNEKRSFGEEIRKLEEYEKYFS